MVIVCVPGSRCALQIVVKKFGLHIVGDYVSTTRLHLAIAHFLIKRQYIRRIIHALIVHSQMI